MRIEKDFVPYEEALALKELGFDEPCFGFWNYNDSKMYYWNDEEIQNERTNKWFLDTEKKFPKISKNGRTAPTFSQAFRFFREKYGYDIHIKGTIFRASYVIGTPKEINMESVDGYPIVISWDYITDEKGERKTYEEAELACLRKLIEIVKNL